MLNDNTNHLTNNEPTSTKFVKIPFHKNLAPKMKNLFKHPEVKVAFYNTKTNKKFFNRKIKDKTPIQRQTNVVYQIPCTCNKVYIGQTSQYVKERVSNHKTDVKKGNDNTGLAQHILNGDTSHNMQWDKIQILEKESDLNKRSHLEAFHIVCNKNNINVQSDFKKCSAIYQNVLNKFK